LINLKKFGATFGMGGGAIAPTVPLLATPLYPPYLGICKSQNVRVNI